MSALQDFRARAARANLELVSLHVALADLGHADCSHGTTCPLCMPLRAAIVAMVEIDRETRRQMKAERGEVTP